MAPRLTLDFSCVEQFKSSVILHFNSVENSWCTAANNTELQHTINKLSNKKLKSLCRNDVKKILTINKQYQRTSLTWNTEWNDDLEIQTLQ